MPHRRRDTVTVSPPTFDRTAFARIDAALPAPHAPFDRDWLMARFAEGLQIRLLKPPHEGLVMFQPGRLAWRPIDAAADAVIVHDLRAGPGVLARENAARLWAAAEHFAQYYGFSAVAALLGDGPGLISPAEAPGRGWVTIDHGPGDVRLVGRILQGPVALPRLPADWHRRLAALGTGLVIQTTRESRALDRLAAARVAALGRRGLPACHQRLEDAAAVRQQAISPGAAYSVACNGRFIGGPDLTVESIAAHATTCLDQVSQSPE